MKQLTLGISLATILISVPSICQTPLPSSANRDGFVGAHHTSAMKGECLDTAYSPSTNNYSLIYKNTVMLFVKNSAKGMNLIKKIKMPIASNRHINPVYRNGEVWSEGNEGLYKLDGNEWKLGFPFPKGYNQSNVVAFSISDNDEVELFATYNNFIEIYNLKSHELTFTIPWDHKNPTIPKQHHWNAIITSKAGSELAIYSPLSGKFYIFNEINKALKLINMPWKPALHKEGRPEGLSVTHRYTFPMPDDIEIFPGDANTFLISYGMPYEVSNKTAEKAIIDGEKTSEWNPLIGRYYLADIDIKLSMVKTNFPLIDTHLLANPIFIWPDTKGNYNSISTLFDPEVTK